MSASGTLILHLTLVFWYFLLCQSGRCHLLSFVICHFRLVVAVLTASVFDFDN